MRSKNDLSITGVIASVSPDRKSMTIVHNYGGGAKPLFLTCSNVSAPVAKGMNVAVTGFIRPGRYGIDVFIKTLQLN